MIRVLLRRLLAWQPRNNRHPYLAVLWIALGAITFLVALILLA